MKTGVKILYFADQWDDKWRRRQQIALRLSRLPVVGALYYVELPLSITSFIKYIFGVADLEAKIRWARVLKKGFVFKYENITVITPLSIVPYFTHFAFTGFDLWVVRKSFTMHLPKQYTPDIFWSSLPFDILWLKYYSGYKLVYDCSENYAALWQNISDKINTWDNELTKRAAVVFVQTNTMVTVKKKHNNNTHLLENACDYNKYIESSDMPIKMAHISRPIIGYSGSINNRINFEIVKQLALKKPSWSFVFIGPYDMIPIKEPNTYFLGEMPYDQLVACVKHFDVCIMPHVIEGVAQSQSPLKLFDYLASGRPIVTTEIQGIKGYENMVYIVNDVKSFISAIEDALVNDNDNRRNERRKTAEICSWENRVVEMLNILNISKIL